MRQDGRLVHQYCCNIAYKVGRQMVKPERWGTGHRMMVRLHPVDGEYYQRVLKSEIMPEHSGSGVKVGFDWVDKGGTQARRVIGNRGNIQKT